MNLREFVRESLTEIAGGIADAAAGIAERGGAVNPDRPSSADTKHGTARQGGTLVPIELGKLLERHERRHTQ